MLLRELHKQAQLEGGAVYMLNGNHESLNVSGNFRWATAPLACHAVYNLCNTVSSQAVASSQSMYSCSL